MVSGTLCAAEPGFAPGDVEFFERRVRPILVDRCHECHSAKSGKRRGGLVLDDRGAILRGGDSGPAVLLDDVDKGLLVEAVRYGADGLQMPPTGRLPQSEIEVLVEWVRRGLPYPSAPNVQAAREGVDFAKGRHHWAFQPLREQTLPAGAAPTSNRIDAFIEAKLREHNLAPLPQADPRTLIRRAYFDLVGLPPTAAEVETFATSLPLSPPPLISPSPKVASKRGGDKERGRAGDTERDAYHALVDRLLASPHYGERWGRYWLDLTRYADVTESWREGDGAPWRYRDWVVAALNADLPYDEFVRRQLAADLIAGTTPADNAALGFLGLSPTYWKELKLDHQVIKQVVAEEWEEQLDAIGGTFLGLTIACARCHDHKFDPISTQDYYALAGVLASIRQTDVPTIDAAVAEPAMAARAKARAVADKLGPLKAKKSPTEAEQAEIALLEKQLGELRQTPNFDLPIACGVVDAALHVLPSGKNATRLEFKPGEAQDVAMQVRGNPSRTGEVVPRRFLSVLATDPQATFRRGSGRLDLADALVTDAGPLAARVIVNRVWEHHFGRGLVDTPSNFGLQGSPPTHPELLDDLTARFVAAGWSLKWLHREIMTSDAYRRSSRREPGPYAIDPENKWLWRMSPRRLEVEAWRDSMLAAAGTLDRTVGGRPQELDLAENNRRTLYGTVKRRELSDLLRLHDFPDPVAHSANRTPTTTPLQQLFVLNGEFVLRQCRDIVERMRREGPNDAALRLAWLYRTLHQRPPSDDETLAGIEFVAAATAEAGSSDEAWRALVQVLLASNEMLFID